MIIDDDILYDAINAFALSPTGRGQSRLGTLGTDVVRSLWAFRSGGRIVAENLPANVASHYWSHSIPWEKSKIVVDPDHVPTSFSPEGIALFSLLLVHEGAHHNLSWSDNNYASEEVRCRRLELYYWNDLKSSGVRMHSPKSTAGPVVIREPPDTEDSPWTDIWGYLRRSHLIDYVIAIGDYGSGISIPWIQRNMHYWRGLAHRAPRTKAYYLTVIVNNGSRFSYQSVNLIYRVLESIGSPSEWMEVKSFLRRGDFLGAGAIDRLRYATGYSRTASLSDRIRSSRTGPRINAVERRIGEQIFSQAH